MTIKAFIYPLLILTIILVSSFTAAKENYCNDPESWKEWDMLIQRHPNDTDIQTLHALRLGLCAKVERGDLTVEDATDIFERARETILRHKAFNISKEKKGL